MITTEQLHAQVRADIGRSIHERLEAQIMAYIDPGVLDSGEPLRDHYQNLVDILNNQPISPMTFSQRYGYSSTGTVIRSPEPLQLTTDTMFDASRYRVTAYEQSTSWTTVSNTPEEAEMTAPVFMTLADYKLVVQHLRNAGNGVPYRRRSAIAYSSSFTKFARSSWAANLMPLIEQMATRNQAQYGTDYDVFPHQGIDGDLAFALFQFACKTPSDVSRFAIPRDNMPHILFPEKYVTKSTLFKDIETVTYGHDGNARVLKAVAHQCPHCGTYVLKTETNGVRTEHRHTTSGWQYGSQQWCQTCFNEETYEDAVTGQTYADAMRSGVDTEGNMVCIAAAEGANWYYHDGEWSEYSFDSDDDDDGDRSSNADGIPHYHDAQRKHFIVPTRFTSALQRTYGVELEVEFTDRSSRSDFFHNNFESEGITSDELFSAELDGSLDDWRGLEIISAPMTLESYQEPDSAWKKMCHKLFEANARGWPVRDHYGMHVNVDIRPVGMSLDEAFSRDGRDALFNRAAKLAAFFNNNRELTIKLAGRAQPYSAGPIQKYAKFDDARRTFSQGKYAVAMMKSESLMEVRIFGSNIRHEGILRNVEYVDSGLAYISEPSAQLFHSMTTSSYRAWVLRPENRKRWPTISAYLEAKITPANIDIKRAVA